MHPVTILIAEDEALIAMSLRRELERAGYMVSGCIATAEAAIECVKQAVPDVILMDIRLAGPMTGVDAAQQIRASHGVPIIFMTGFGRDTYKESVDALKPSALLIKPVSMSALKNTIVALFGGG